MRILIAIALLCSITPGLSEVLETGIHLIVHADLPHHGSESGSESESDRGCSEHACTPLSHHCGCHTTMSAQTSTRTVDPVADRVTKVNPMAIAAVLGKTSEPPPLRPPIG